MVSFKSLKDQKMLRQGSTPRCVKQEQILPDFVDTTKYFSQDGFFVHQAMFFKPGAYCVDGELDTEPGKQDEEWDREQQQNEQAAHIVVVVCGEKGEAMGVCEEGQTKCYGRW